MTGRGTRDRVLCAHGYVLMQDSCPSCAAAQEMPLEADMVPGQYEMTAEEYHADPVPGGSLTSSGARKLLPPHCPARFRHGQQVGPATQQAFDLGSAVHTMLLGGPEVVVAEYQSWRSAAAVEAREEIRSRGAIPLLPADAEHAIGMAAALRSHETAGPLLEPGTGEPEQTYIWRDEETGIWCRALLDWVRPLDIVDVKTTSDSSPEEIQRSVAKYGYHQQAAWYRDARRAVDGLADSPFFFTVVEKTPPYLVQVVELDEVALAIGAARNRRARQIYADCQRTGIWPGRDTSIRTISLPSWAERRDLEEYL